MDNAQLPRLEDLRINGCREFDMTADDALARLEEAHALLKIFSAAHQVCDNATGSDTGPIAAINHQIQYRAFDGIATLIALAQHHLEVAAARKSANQEGN